MFSLPLQKHFSRAVQISRTFFADSHYRNSAYLTIDQLMLSGFGFLFWLVAAQNSSPRQIGEALSLLGILGLLGSAGVLGIPNTIMRFLAGESDQKTFVELAILVTFLVSLLLSVTWVFFLGSPGSPLDSSSFTNLVSILGICAMTVGSVGASVFIARRRARFILVKDFLGIATKFVVLYLVLERGAKGLLLSQISASCISTLVVIVAILRLRRRKKSTFSNALIRLRHLSGFAVWTHAAMLVSIAPNMLMPAVILSRSGAASASYVAISMMFLSAVNTIPQSLTTTLIAEIAHNPQSARKAVIRTLRTIYVTIIPVIIGGLIVAPYLLQLYGSGYQKNATACFRLLLLGLLLTVLNYLSDSLLLAYRLAGYYFVSNFVGMIFVFGGVYVSASNGPTGIAIGWLIGQAGYLTISLVCLLISEVIVRKTSTRSRVRYWSMADLKS